MLTSTTRSPRGSAPHRLAMTQRSISMIRPYFSATGGNCPGMHHAAVATDHAQQQFLARACRRSAVRSAGRTARGAARRSRRGSGRSSVRASSSRRSASRSLASSVMSRKTTTTPLIVVPARSGAAEYATGKIVPSLPGERVVGVADGAATGRGPRAGRTRRGASGSPSARWKWMASCICSPRSSSWRPTEHPRRGGIHVGQRTGRRPARNRPSAMVSITTARNSSASYRSVTSRTTLPTPTISPPTRTGKKLASQCRCRSGSSALLADEVDVVDRFAGQRLAGTPAPAAATGAERPRRPSGRCVRRRAGR